MPTGYTADVADGTTTSLTDFAMRLARGMGALVMMRDDAWDAPIPERFEPSDYHPKKLAEIKASLDELRAMIPADWQAAADALVTERVAAAEKWRADRAVQRERYDAMIAKVEAWQNSPEGIRKFALDQLTEGRRFDCPDRESYYESIEPMSGEEWKVEREATLMKESAYHAAEYQKEIDRTEGRNAWLKQLRASLAEAEAAKKGAK